MTREVMEKQEEVLHLGQAERRALRLQVEDAEAQRIKDLASFEHYSAEISKGAERIRTLDAHIATWVVLDGVRVTEILSLLAEVKRLKAWLRKIEGVDYPCTAAARLRGWAHQAVTLQAPCDD